MYHKNIIQKWGPNTQSNWSAFLYVVRTVINVLLMLLRMHFLGTWKMQLSHNTKYLTMTKQETNNVTFMRNLKAPKNNVNSTLLKICCCNLMKETSQWWKWNVTLMLFTHVIQTYHRKPSPKVFKNMLL